MPSPWKSPYGISLAIFSVRATRRSVNSDAMPRN
jgi:hypothetical protein